jgi:hypothetical protein
MAIRMDDAGILEALGSTAASMQASISMQKEADQRKISAVRVPVSTPLLSPLVELSRAQDVSGGGSTSKKTSTCIAQTLLN